MVAQELVSAAVSELGEMTTRNIAVKVGTSALWLFFTVIMPVKVLTLRCLQVLLLSLAVALASAACPYSKMSAANNDQLPAGHVKVAKEGVEAAVDAVTRSRKLKVGWWLCSCSRTVQTCCLLSFSKESCKLRL